MEKLDSELLSVLAEICYAYDIEQRALQEAAWALDSYMLVYAWLSCLEKVYEKVCLKEFRLIK